MIYTMAVDIHNMYEYGKERRFVVTTAPVDGKLWFFAAFDDYEKAQEACQESGGIIIEHNVPFL